MPSVRDKATVHSELEAAQKRAASLDSTIKAGQEELEVLRGSWSRPGLLVALQRELEDAGLPSLIKGGDTYVVVTLTPKQASLRKYGTGEGGGRYTVRAAGARDPLVTLEECRAAWVAAGKELPK